MAAGLVVALCGVRLMSSLLFNVSAVDPLTYARPGVQRARGHRLLLLGVDHRDAPPAGDHHLPRHAGVPVVGILASVLFLGEPPSVSLIGGLVGIICGLALVVRADSAARVVPG